MEMVLLGWGMKALLLGWTVVPPWEEVAGATEGPGTLQGEAVMPPSVPSVPP